MKYRSVRTRNRYLKLAKESPTPPAEEPGRDLPNAISRGKLLDWFDLAAKVVNQYGMHFENTLTRDEEDIFRQWIGTHTWGHTIMALYRLADGEGKTSPDPCRLYFDNRDDYYRQAVGFDAAPAPERDTPEAPQFDPGPPARRARILEVDAQRRVPISASGDVRTWSINDQPCP